MYANIRWSNMMIIIGIYYNELFWMPFRFDSTLNWNFKILLRFHPKNCIQIISFALVISFEHASSNNAKRDSASK